MIWFIYVAIFLASLLASFRYGRLVGGRQGERRANVEMPIRLRTEFQLEQRCPICDDKRIYGHLISRDQR